MASDKLEGDWVFEAVLAETNDIVLITEPNLKGPDGPKILFVNQAFEKLTGYSKEEAIGQTPRILQGPKTDKNTLNQIKRALSKGKKIRVELLNYHKNGTEYWLDFCVCPIFDDKGNIKYFSAIERDITEYKMLHEKLYFLASKDSLTGAFNRHRFYEAAQDAIIGFRRENISFGLLVIDVDEFKSINDNQGHLVGDEQLKRIADTCRSVSRGNDCLCRFGGDEFLMIFHKMDTAKLEIKAKALVESINDAEDIFCSVSIGGTICKESDSSIDALISRADEALYAAKESGKNTFQIFEKLDV